MSASQENEEKQVFHVTESTLCSGKLWPGHQHPSLSQWGAGFPATTSLLGLYLCRSLDALACVCLRRGGGKPADTFLRYYSL